MEQIGTLTTDRLSRSLTFSPALPLEMALNEIARSGGAEIYSDGELAKEFDLTSEQLKKINTNPAFREQVLQHKANVKQDQGSIKKKCGLILESYLHDLVPMTLSDPTVSIAEKTKLLTLLAEISGVKGGKSDAAIVAESMAKATSQPQIVLNFPPGFQNPMTPALEAERVPT